MNTTVEQRCSAFFYIQKTKVDDNVGMISRMQKFWNDMFNRKNPAPEFVTEENNSPIQELKEESRVNAKELKKLRIRQIAGAKKINYKNDRKGGTHYIYDGYSYQEYEDKAGVLDALKSFY